MTKYFLFYKYYNNSWAKKNFSCIILPNGNIYSYNNSLGFEDIFDRYPKTNPSKISLEHFNTAMFKGNEIITNKPISIDVQDFNYIELTKDDNKKINDGDYEVYALFKYNTEQYVFDFIPLQILDIYYYRFTPKSLKQQLKKRYYQKLITLIGKYNTLITN